ncbi:MAG: PAS domain S-box protein, partial [Bryobacteraceae bacterium]|nr:PAS domain S-box protein [Bryobacteraceae bacterium]
MTSELTNELAQAQRRVKELEEALERERSKHRSDDGSRLREVTTETQEFALILLDREGKIQGWSRGAEKLHGYAAAEMIGQPVAVLYTEEERRNHQPQKELEQAQKEGRFVGRNWLLRKKAKPFCAESVTVPMFDAAGNLAGLSRLTYDVTGKPGAESQLRSRVAEQTAIADLAVLALSAGPAAQWMQAACNRLKETLGVDLA